MNGNSILPDTNIAPYLLKGEETLVSIPTTEYLFSVIGSQSMPVSCEVAVVEENIEMAGISGHYCQRYKSY